MVSGSPIGDDVFGQSSPAAEAKKVYSSSDTTIKGLPSRSSQAAFAATCTSSFLPSEMVLAAAAPYLAGPEDGEPPGGGD